MLTFMLNAAPRMFKYMLVLGLLFFISLFFPNKATFEYEYQLGERWRYDDLSAPFDYPLLKYDNELAAEQSQFKTDFVPYYNIDTQLVYTQIDSFNQQLRRLFIEYPADFSLSDSSFYLNWGKNILNYIYARRIILVDSIHIDKKEDFSCILLDNNMEMGEFYLKTFINNQQAAQMLIDTLAKTKKIANNKLILELLSELISQPNVTFNPNLTQQKQIAAQQNLSRFRSMVKTGELIVVQEGVIDSLICSKLRSLEFKYNEEINQHKSGLLMYLGYLGITLALLSIYVVFLRFYNQEILNNSRHLSMLLCLIGFYAYLSYGINQLPYLSEFIILNFFSGHLALFTHILIVLVSAMLLSLDYQFILLQLIAGMVAIITKLKTRYLTDFFASILYIGFTYTIVYIGLELTRSGVIFPIKDATGLVLEQGIRWPMLVWVALNIFLTLLSFPLIPMLEKFFGLTSEITLVELTDLNKPLLKELSVRAAGTLQHSLQVAHLSESAATAIQANALLVRVAALYHDIGKMNNPEFFIENQHGSNPHDKLAYLDSAKMIISHVSDGLELAHKYKLPTIVSDFIKTHHGTTRVEYFYRKYTNENPLCTVPDTQFRYPGPRPRNREEAILMMADSLEAASRSLPNPTEEDIDNLVDNIIKGKIAHNQFIDTNLSFQELETVKNVFKKQLKSIHHVRIAYPTSNN
jgi:cyclic-di-AMP phosphodiesterase PgpH